MASLAAETRSAIDARPYLKEALRAGVLNVAAAARYLDLEGEHEAVATALRRYAEELESREPRERAFTVRMERRVTDVNALLSVGGEGQPLVQADPDGARTTAPTALVVTGDVDARLVGTVLTRLAETELTLIGAGMAEERAVFLVPNGSGSTALRIVEESGAHAA
ncbi:MAG: hypothetical protein ABEJ27_03430 [Halodesulfurarchaeum sp.]